MSRPVPIVVAGSGPVAARFLEVLGTVAGDLAGREAFQLEVVDSLAGAAEAGVLVDTGEGSGPGSVDAAVADGHAAATADLSIAAGDAARLGVLLADRRIGLAAALLPGLPLVSILHQAWLLEVEPEVTIDGASIEQLRDEVVAAHRLLGGVLGPDDVRVASGPEGTPTAWRGVLRPGRWPTIDPVADVAPTDRRAVAIRWPGADLPTELAGPTGTVEQVATALLHDVVALAREGDAPWRAHRRRNAAGPA